MPGLFLYPVVMMPFDDGRGTVCHGGSYYVFTEVSGGRMSIAANHPATFASAPASATTQVRTRSASVPWYVWIGVVAVTSASVGGAWDVSWHRSIGRDTFWTPAHMAIYACGVLAGFLCAWLIAECTFGRDGQLPIASVS